MSPIRLLPAALLAVALPLAGCAAGQNDTTSHERGTPYTADGKAGPVRVSAVTIVPVTSSATSTPSASPTPTDTATPATASPTPSASPSESPTPASDVQAYLTLTLVSSTQDTLTGVSIQGATITPSATGDALTVHPNSALVIGSPDTAASSGQPTLTISGMAKPPVVGTTMKVTFTFQTAGSVTIDVPVREPYAA